MNEATQPIRQVRVSSTNVEYSGYASDTALQIAEDYAYNEVEGSVIWVDADNLPCDKYGTLIDLLYDCDFGDVSDRDRETIGIDFTFEEL